MTRPTTALFRSIVRETLFSVRIEGGYAVKTARWRLYEIRGRSRAKLSITFNALFDWLSTPDARRLNRALRREIAEHAITHPAHTVDW